MKNKEIRTLKENSELRAETETRTVEGYGIVFNSVSQDLGGFVEVIKPEAVEGVIEKSDILALMNHDQSRGILARSINGAGSMSLTTTTKGVKYSFKAPNTALGQELIEGITRGDIRGSSFAFRIDPEGETIEKRTDGTFLRTITKFDRIMDMSPCYRETYQDTTVALRSLDEYKDISKEKLDENGNPIVEDPTKGKLPDNSKAPELTNAVLAMRARNNSHKKK